VKAIFRNQAESRLFFWAVLATAIAKLILVASNEIVALPNDSVNYAHQATDSLSEIGAAAGYPYWLALSGVLGFPQRVTIELLYLFSVLSIALSMVRVTGNAFALLSFGALAFLPATFFLFDNALSDGFYACLTLIALSLMIDALLDIDFQRRTYWIRLSALALVMGWMLITRNEDFLLVGWVCWFVICRFLRSDSEDRKRAIIHGVLAAGFVLLGAFSVVWSVSAFHAVTKGVFARALATLPSHMMLLRNIASIDTEAPPIRRVPITQAQRDAAYGASPTLRHLRAYIESPDNMFQVASARAGFRTGELGAGWVWHVFNMAAIEYLPKKSLKNLDEFYRTTNAELETAFAAKRLSRKFVFHPLLGGAVGDLLSALPGSVAKVYNAAFESVGLQRDAGFESRLFDIACLRRASLVHLPGYGGLVQGWAFADFSEGVISSAEVGVYEAKNGIANARWFATEPVARPDVKRGLERDGRDQTDVFGFRVFLHPTQGDAAIVRYFLSDGSSVTSPPLVARRVSQIKQEPTSRLIVHGIDAAGSVEQASPPGGRFAVQELLIGLFGRYFYYAFGVVVALGAALALFFKNRLRCPDDGRPIMAVTALITGLLLQRILFYAVIDTGGWDIEVRYLCSATVLIMLIFVLFAALLYFLFRARPIGST
jgi:hypothetical protein